MIAISRPTLKDDSPDKVAAEARKAREVLRYCTKYNRGVQLGYEDSSVLDIVRDKARALCHLHFSIPDGNSADMVQLCCWP